MENVVSSWPVCGKCCEVSVFPWMGGSHRCRAPGVVQPSPKALEHAVWSVVAQAVERGVRHIEVTLHDDGIRVADVEHDCPAFTFESVGRAVQLIAAIYPGVTIELYDDRCVPEAEPHRQRTISFPDGPVGYVRHLNRTKAPLHPGVISVRGTHGGVGVEVAMQWNTGYSESIVSFVDAVPTPDGGPHEDSFRDAVWDAVWIHGVAQILPVEDIDQADACEGLSALIAVTEPPAGSRGVSVTRAIEYLCRGELVRWFEANPDAAWDIVRKAWEASVERRTPRRTSCRG